jgi:hypothetical protein
MVRNPQLDPPEWWGWDLAFTAHVESRMEARQFSESELRTMITRATALDFARRPGRYPARTRHAGVPWIDVLEPDVDDRLLFVVTAYPVEQR